MSDKIQPSERKLSAKVIYTYSLGDFGMQFFAQFVAFYLMFFLTTVAMVPVMLAAVLYTVIQWFETTTVVISGAIIDRINFKSGRFRPWLIIGSVACFIGTIGFFTRWDISTNAFMVVFAVFYLIGYWGFNLVWISVRALNGIIGKDAKEIATLTVSGNLFSAIAVIIFSLVAVRLLDSFATVELGYSISAIVYGLIMVLCSLAVFKISKPYDTAGRSVNESTTRRKSVSFFVTVKALKGPMIPFFISLAIRASVAAPIATLMIFHFRYSVGDSAAVASFIMFHSIAMLVGAFLLKFFVHRLDKKLIYIISTFCSSAVFAIAYFFNMNTTVFIGLFALNSLFTAFCLGLLPAFMSDIADYNKYEQGADIRAFVFSIGATASRVASIIGSGIAAFGLAFIGYVPGPETQPDSVLRGIVLIVTFGMSFLGLLAAIPMFFYKLDEKRMEPIYAKKNEQAQLQAR
jgi:GPH family glycoside/pentoside/hexuronide:cation symporter